MEKRCLFIGRAKSGITTGAIYIILGKNEAEMT
jgi:hypothetical protein